MTESEKPKFEEVYAYAKKSVDHFLRKHAYQMAPELKEEIAQNAMMRVWEAYQKLEADKGWKSFIQLHCRGAVLDFIKMGSFEDGFVSGSEEGDLQSRIEIISEDSGGSVLSEESTAALFGIFTDTNATEGELKPNWTLLSKMIGKDESLHILAKILYGFSQEEVAQQLATDLGVTISRERVSQRIQEYQEQLDSPVNIGDAWIEQSIFALGLCSRFHMPEKDSGLGHDLKSFDISDPESFRKARQYYEPSLFDFLGMNQMCEIFDG